VCCVWCVQLALESGEQSKPLTAWAVEKHLSDLGIAKQDASQTAIRYLSVAQKFQVVLAAATWQNPHVMVLDEPTTYLDRDSLGSIALVMAIREYKGGVIIISQDKDFVRATCQEKWIVDGTLRRIGEAVAPLEPEPDMPWGERFRRWKGGKGMPDSINVRGEDCSFVVIAPVGIMPVVVYRHRSHNLQQQQQQQQQQHR
jgi:energy-coupling factor transporter ATP-binding protein EcfA2